MHNHFHHSSPDLPLVLGCFHGAVPRSKRLCVGLPGGRSPILCRLSAGSFVNEVHFKGQSPHAIVTRMQLHECIESKQQEPSVRMQRSHSGNQLAAGIPIKASRAKGENVFSSSSLAYMRRVNSTVKRQFCNLSITEIPFLSRLITSQIPFPRTTQVSW